MLEHNSNIPLPKRTLSVAPMMDWTDRFCRYFHRTLSKNTWLYTEMVTTGAILFGDKSYQLDYHEAEHPLALQLGGSDPKALAECAKIAEEWGYDEINLNCGCPSDRVQSGFFGACLMAEPAKVADCVAAMQAQVNIPVTVKTRIGIDHQDSWDFFYDFVNAQIAAGSKTLVIHARKAWLKGLSPKENREKPPLDYERVLKLKQLHPEIEILINGGFRTHESIQEQLSLGIDGVMVGREAYENPWFLHNADALFYPTLDGHHFKTRKEVIRAQYDFWESHLQSGKKGISLHLMTRHVLGLFNGLRGARSFRRHLSENAGKKGSGPELVEQALAMVEE